MKVVNFGNTYDVYNGTLNTYDMLPTQTYYVRFQEFKGFYLEKRNNIEIGEDKIYGVHTEKVQKVLNAFSKFTRNLGVILSGDKGIGKSLFARCLSVSAAQMDIPTIIVDQYIPGIDSYIEKIEQEVLVLFDEFEKTFSKEEEQTSLLSLFDGYSTGKKLFVITCNDYRRLNQFLINRPGRFHYHIQFKYPTTDEIREYLRDKVEPQYHNEIDGIVRFAQRSGNINYDCLRAIAFELNMGVCCNDALSDINIIKTDDKMFVEAELYYSNGVVIKDKTNIDMSEEFEVVYLNDNKGDNVADASFYMCNVKFNYQEGYFYVDAEDISVEYDSRYSDTFKERIKDANIVKLVMRRHYPQNIHYTL